jgi:hypothetical protein
MSCYSFHAALRAIHLGISHQLNVILEFKSRLGVILPRDKVHNERVLDGEDRVIVQVLVLAVEDLGSQRAVAFLGSLGEYISLSPTSRRRGES